MKLPLIKRLDRQDLQGKGDIPGWMDSLLGTLNMFLDPVARALQGRLTFSDNFFCKVTTQTFTHATELSISVPPNLRVIGALPLLAIKSTDTATSTKNVITGLGMNLKGNGQVGVIVNFAGGAGIQAAVTLVILFG